MENLLSKLAALRFIRIKPLVLLAAIITIILVSVTAYLFSNKLLVNSQNISDSSIRAKDATIERIKKELDDLKNQDQLKVNLALAEEIKNINKTYQQASTLYERLVDLRKSIKTDKLDPLYVTGGRNNFGGSSDPKITSRGARTFIANKGNMVYIGIVYNSGASEAAAVLTIMGMENALGLDQGGSTALWSGGYKAGPGRNIPNAVLFVRR